LGAVVGVAVSWWALETGTLIDTGVFRHAALAVLAGQSPYGLPTTVPFIYPPAGVLLAMPDALGASVRSAEMMWLAISLAALARTTWMLVRRAWPALERERVLQRSCGLFAAACLLEPTLITLSFGQVGLVLLWLTVEGLDGQPRSSRRAWLLGVATAIKLTPAVVLLGLLAARRWQAAFSTVVGLVAACAAAAVVTPAGVSAYVGGAWRFAGDVSATPDLLNHSLIGIAVLVDLPGWAGLACAAIVLVVGISLTGLLWRHGDELAGLATVLVTGILASPISWGHHWVAIYPALVLLLREARPRRLGVVSLLVTATVGMLLWVDQAGLTGSRAVPAGQPWWLLPREWYVAWGVIFLGWVSTSLRGEGHSELPGIADAAASR
jgi:alpha-1,2-mannosyltransferase